MAEQARKYGVNIPKMVAVGTGLFTLSSAVYGLYLSFKSLLTAMRGGFTEVVQQYEVPYFYPAFYSMLSVTVVCCLVLVWCGFDQVRLRLVSLKLFVGLFIFQILYLVSIGGFLWALPNVGMSVAAATGVTIKGLMPPLFILLPIWAPFTLIWAKKRLTNSSLSHLTEPLQTEAAGRSETTLARMIRGRLLTALVGGVGGTASFFLLLSVATSFDGLNEHISAFTFHVVAFLLGGFCVIYSAMLDSPISRRMPGWHYMAVVLVVLASYFATSLWFQKSLSTFSLLPMAVSIAIVLNGFSLRALRNCLWAFAGSVLGIGSLGIVLSAFAAVFGIVSFDNVKRTLDPAGVSFPLVFLIRHGFVWYGFTLGLLLSQPPPQREDVASTLTF